MFTHQCQEDLAVVQSKLRNMFKYYQIPQWTCCPSLSVPLCPSVWMVSFSLSPRPSVWMLSFSLSPSVLLCECCPSLCPPLSFCVNVVLLSVPLCPSVWMLSFSLSPSVWMSSFSLISVWMLFFSLPLCGNIVLVAAPLCECCPSLCPSVLMLFLSLSVLLCPYVWMLSFSLSLCVNVVLVLYIIFIKSIQSPDCHGSPHILGLVLD